MNRSIPVALLASAACLHAGTVAALTYCVNTVAEIQIAINDAETNNDDDLIRIVAGNYEPPDGYTFNSTESNSLTIRGGYNANCTVFTGATTTIDGNQQVRPLSVLISNGGVVIENLTFVGGLADGNEGGGLKVQTATGDVRIDRNTFIGNHADLSGGGLRVFATGGDVRVRNNLVVGNSTSQSEAMSIVLTNGGDAYIVGNTIVANAADSDTATAGLGIGGGSYFVISNNIIWNNNPGASSGVDFGASIPAGHSRFNNDIGVVRNGTVADFVVAEQSVNPQFQSCGGFLCFNGELKRTSPLVDAGTDSPLGGMPTRDLAYKDRIIGPHVDIGAYENDLIFADGFD